MMALGFIGYPGGYFAQFHCSNLHKIVNKNVTYVPSSVGILGDIQEDAAAYAIPGTPQRTLFINNPIRGKLEA
jgi:hypothetical protein